MGYYLWLFGSRYWLYSTLFFKLNVVRLNWDFEGVYYGSRYVTRLIKIRDYTTQTQVKLETSKDRKSGLGV